MLKKKIVEEKIPPNNEKFEHFWFINWPQVIACLGANEFMCKAIEAEWFQFFSSYIIFSLIFTSFFKLILKL
jgi:hypothetical protein